MRIAVCTWQIGWRLYFAHNPLKLTVWTGLVQGVFQLIFFYYFFSFLTHASDPDKVFRVALALTTLRSMTTVAAIVPLVDKADGVFWRIRSAVPTVWSSLLIRTLPYVLMGLCFTVLQGLLVSLIFRQLAWAQIVLANIPSLFLILCAAMTLVICTSTLSIAHRADVFAPNLSVLVLTFCTGAAIPTGKVAWLDAISTFIPASHAIAAFYDHAVCSAEWFIALGTEVFVISGYLGLFYAATQWVQAAVRRTGHDDFA